MWGDHNVFALREDDLDICPAETVAELYDFLRGKKVLAIPHHTAYRTGARGKDWNVLDETLSPFCEIFSVHGCSEVDDEYCKLRSNSHMAYKAKLHRPIPQAAYTATFEIEDNTPLTSEANYRIRIE